MADESPTHYVGIGASAGGLEAIESFFKSMPIDSGVAFIIIQHLSPDYKSLMTELLSKRTAMQVHRAEEGMRVLANNVYLIPPKKNLRIFHGKLLLTDPERDRQGLNLPIDIFFKSLAEDQGDKAIGIVLSGTGSDGTRGVRAIKEANGMVMAQSEESAKFDGMPRSVIALGVADFILPPTQMPPQLAAYVKHPYVTKQENSEGLLTEQDGMTRIYALLREHSRIDFTYYKPATVVRRIERRMTINQTNDLSEYLHYLENNRDEVNILYRELLIGVTNFFRDHEAFELVANKYLPALIRDVENREVRVWVAGCSTGEEAYTIAILCREAMAQYGIAREVKIFATDVDHHAIETASDGKYPESIVTDIPTDLLTKYFTRHEDGSYQIVRSVREMVVFAQHNLIRDPPFTKIDFVSCRNLLIYLQPVLQRKALELFNFSLTPEGLMLLGTSETTGDMSEYFEPLQHKWRIYRSRGKRKITGIELGSASVDHNRVMRSRLSGKYVAARIQHEEERVLDRYLQAFAGDFVQFSMVLNDSMEVIHAIGDTGNFLRMQPGMISQDAGKLIIKELSIPLSTGVQKVLKKNEPLTFSKIRVITSGGEKMMQMRLKPLPSKKGQSPLVGVFVNEMIDRGYTEPGLIEGETFEVSKEAENRIADLEQELQFTRENLQATVEELETSNEELQATNEELLASNEELQSTNEELQSVNEELYTVNAEYQSKITELTELTNDLDNLLSSTSIGTLFLGEDLDIRRFSSKATELLNLIEADVGRPLSHISHKLGSVSLDSIARGVLTTGKLIEHEFHAENGTFYLVRALPYRIASEVYAGVVLIFIDITRQKLAEEELKRSQSRYQLAQEHANIGTWDWDIKADDIYWSSNVAAILGREADAFSGKYKDFLSLVYAEDRPAVEQAVKTSMKTGNAYDIDHRIRMADGELRWFKEHGKPEFDELGTPTRMIGTVHDITRTKMIELEFQRITADDPSVLLVDDEPGILTLLREVLSRYEKPLNIVTARNGFQALILAARHNPLLVISDLIMPEMDGFRLLRSLRHDPMLSPLPALVVTALTDEEIDGHGGLPDGTEILRKPLQYEDMVRLIWGKLDALTKQAEDA